MRQWLRRNAVALVAATVLVPATALIIGGSEWWAYYSGRDVFPVTVEPGEAAEFSGATYGPATITEFAEDPEWELPPGVKVLSAEVPIRTGDGPARCGTPTLRELAGDGRRWTVAPSPVDLPYDEDASSLCDSERTGTYTVAVAFLVPDDVSGLLGLDFTVVDELPRFLRLVVDVP
jgi:hypothetical protein